MDDGGRWRLPGARPGGLRTVAYFIASAPLRIVEFVITVVGLAVGLATTPIWVGLPVLSATLWLTRRFCERDRRWIRALLDVQVPPTPRDAVEDGAGWLQHTYRAIISPRSRRDVGYLTVALPLGMVELALGLVAIPLFPVAVWGVPWVGRFHGWLALVMLRPSRTVELERTAQRLRASRARGVDAAEAERRRLERDLHDGAQQRLVSVAMSLGRARAKFDTEPGAVRELLDEAHSGTKLAITELRDLARGIHPAVLTDRGLDGALSALAAKAPFPVDVEVDITPRPPIAVETAAYFIVGESLTNAAKYSGATRARVRAWRGEHTVTVEISDDGTGGAKVRPGGGLAGLADRAAAIDGVVTVHSPAGGPTMIRAELPCRW